ncbi:glycerol dehydrogenase [Ophiostoma piceae UAMH 11346]|uniref:Glycerol dehydrogenase n=1 Tax=Ophiostoma piceae (strain UAMH 11346) TaxID=1262450 RepID=S3CC20_OPHP1|nr:glycerol dehydrogenase [Ophiostoma piceae UAMH 11346]
MADSTVQNTAKKFVLNTGNAIPAIGLGTWQSKPQDVYNAVKWALAHGYRHIDTAFAYGNEKEVGAAIKDSGIPRKDIWLTTKLDNDWHTRVPEAIDTSLKNLGTDYVDLYLVHWPCSIDPDNKSTVLEGWDFIDTWREMQKLPATGKVLNIGVSNMGIANFEKLLSDPSCKIIPAVNQIELHPANPSPKLLGYCAAKGIHCSGYSPLGSTDSVLYSDDTILAIAKARGRTPQQILLLWGIKNNTSVLPKSVTKERIEANFALDGPGLTDEEFAKISAIQSRFKVCGDSWLPQKMFFGDDE